MGLRIQVPGIVVSNPVAFNPPVSRGLTGLFITVGTDADQVRTNLALAPGAANRLATFAGSPALSSTGMVCANGTNYLNTLVADATLGTAIVIARNEDAPTSSQVPYAACWSDDPGDAYTSNAGASIMQRLPGTAPAGTVTGTIAIQNPGTPTAATVGRVDLTVPDVTAMHAYAAGYDGTSRWAWDLTTPGATKAVSASTPKLPNGAAPWLLGSSASGVTGTGRSRIAAFVYHNVALTNAEIAEWMTFLRAHPRLQGLGF